MTSYGLPPWVADSLERAIKHVNTALPSKHQARWRTIGHVNIPRARGCQKWGGIFERETPLLFAPLETVLYSI